MNNKRRLMDLTSAICCYSRLVAGEVICNEVSLPTVLIMRQLRRGDTRTAEGNEAFRR